MLFRVNVQGVFFVLQAVARLMVRDGRGGCSFNMAAQAVRRGAAQLLRPSTPQPKPRFRNPSRVLGAPKFLTTTLARTSSAPARVEAIKESGKLDGDGGWPKSRPAECKSRIYVES